MIRCQQSPLTQEQVRRLSRWFNLEERHLFEEVVRSRIVQAQVSALEAAESAGRFPDYTGVVEKHLAEAARFKDTLDIFREISRLEGLTISQPTLQPLVN